jgi:hypothetical protein
MVSFDLTNTRPGDVRYRQADASLKMHGDVFRPVKQIRLLLTRSKSRLIKASLEQRLGRQVSIIIIPVKSIPAWRIYGQEKRREWKRFNDAVNAKRIDIRYLAGDAEGTA